MFPIPLSFITYPIDLRDIPQRAHCPILFDRFNRLSLRPIHGYRTITNRGEINGT